MRLLTDIMNGESAESRAHPDNTRDVWELALWDPRAVCSAGLIYFSPVHALVYMMDFPLDPLEIRPSITVFKCILLQVALSGLLYVLHSKNERRLKDTAIIQREVFNEYDTKYVHPRLHPVVRDVATQASMDNENTATVESGTPTTLIRRSFQTHPNPNYLKHIDPDSTVSPPVVRNAMSPSIFTPAAKSRHSDSYMSSQTQKSPSRQSLPAGATTPYAAQVSASGAGFGGSLGAFTHANSPLKKATSLSDINNEGGFFSPRNSRELAAMEQRDLADRMQRRVSPIKEDGRQAGGRPKRQPLAEASPGPALNPFAQTRNNSHRYERYPSRW
jgi:hypothetical protein